jgi:hypothetical protein
MEKKILALFGQMLKLFGQMHLMGSRNELKPDFFQDFLYFEGETPNSCLKLLLNQIGLLKPH